MENQTRNANIPERSTAKATSVSELKTKIDSDTTPFRPRATLLLDIVPAQGVKTVDRKQSVVAAETPEESLQQLLINTEVSAQRTQSAKMKWQAASLVMGMLFAAAAVVIGWLYFEMNMTRTQRGRLAMENQSLKEQLSTTGAQITGFKNEIETLISRNLELVGQSAQLKSQKQPTTAAMPAAAVKVMQKSVAVDASPAAGKTPDASRIEAIRKGTYPKGATRQELTTVFGEPDRIYKSRGYEQYVYFSRKPARFWFFGNYLVQTSE
jgi:hypothetical protein